MASPTGRGPAASLPGRGHRPEQASVSANPLCVRGSSEHTLTSAPVQRVRNKEMLALPAISAGLEFVRVIVIVLAIAGVIFWRVALRIIIILLVISGAVALIQGILHGIM